MGKGGASAIAEICSSETCTDSHPPMNRLNQPFVAPLIALIFAPCIASQGPARTQLKMPATPAVDQAVNAPREGRETQPDEAWIRHATRAPVTDDRPNFAPMIVKPRRDGIVPEDDRDVETVYDGNPYRLSFMNGDYTPKRGVDPALLTERPAAPDETRFGFVMIRGRITAAKLRAITQLGVKLLEPRTWQSFQAKIPLRSLSALGELECVHWVGYARPEQKLDRPLAEALGVAPAGQKFDVWVNLFESDMGPNTEAISVGEERQLSSRHDEGSVKLVVPNGAFQKALEGLGFKFSFYDDSIHAMRGTATKAQILKIRDLNFVVSVEHNHGIGTVDDDQSLAMVGVDRVRGVFPGRDVRMGWIDTGIDASPWHSDFGGKKFRAWRTTTESAYADGHSHGTHVAGTIFGRGVADSRYIGVAPMIGNGTSNTDRIYVGRLLNDFGSVVGNPQTLWDIFKVPQTIGGIRTEKRSIVSNSWSFKSASGYSGTETMSRSLDNVVHFYQQTYLHSSGNTGSTVGTWCGSPSAAKNCLTIGSVRDWFNSTVRPGDVAPTVRYRTTDNRRKPEITAPGEIVTSTRFNTTNGYSNKSGTSMSTPTVAGVLASVVDRNPGFYQYNPSGLRALAVAAAKVGRGVGFDFTYKEGFGLINAHKMNYASARSKFMVRSGALSWPFPNPKRDLATFDFPIDANCQQLKVVLSWTEPAAAATASAARVNGLRVFFDTAPYTAGATGEFSMSSTRDTVIFATSLTNSLKGKTVRFKIHAYSLPPYQRCNYSICVFQYLKTPLLSAPRLTQTVDRTIVKPSQTVLLRSTLTAGATQDEFNNAHIFFDSPSSWAMTQIRRTTADNLLQVYTGSSHPSYPYPRLATGIRGGMTVGQGSSRLVQFYMRAPTTSGIYGLRTGETHHGSSVSTFSNTSSVCVDGLIPNPISGLVANRSTGVWYNSTSARFNWNRAVDRGCAGVSLLRYEISDNGVNEPTTRSPSQSASATSQTINWSGSGRNHYYALRVYDRAGNFSGHTARGPYWVDLTRPTVTSITAQQTRVPTLSVPVRVLGADTWSGPKFIQYSNNGSVWSGNFAYTTAFRSVSLSAYGGTTGEGGKRVYARIVDGAGNISGWRVVTVTYMRPPVITGAPISTLPAVNYDFYRVVGTGFAGDDPDPLWQ